MPTTKWVTDEVFGPLSKRLKTLDVDKVCREAIAIATDEGREMISMEMDAEGAPRALRQAIHELRTSSPYEGAVGVAPRDRSVEDALDWEFGSVDGKIPPHGTFRFVADDMADIASAELAIRLSRAFA